MISKFSVFRFQFSAIERWFSCFTIVALVCLLCSCAHEIKEMTGDFDFVLGFDYEPPLKVCTPTVPAHVLVLPVTGTMQESYKQLLAEEFWGRLSQNPIFKLTPWRGGLVGDKTLTMRKEEVQKCAQTLGCDTVIYIGLQEQQVYPPLRVTAKVVLKRVSDDVTILEGVCDFDAQNKLVANSARDFYQTYLQKTMALNRSLSILENNNLFVRYVGYGLAQSVVHQVIKIKKDIEKQEEAKKSPDNQKEQTPSVLPKKRS